MYDFSKMLNWKLKAGSHKFPGDDGGTCINEAAIVAAGFPYREITDVADCPPCFSRVISSFAIVLNDSIQDEDTRNELLMPFVLRLAGSADSPVIEYERAVFMLKMTIHHFNPVFDYRGSYKDWANQFSAYGYYDANRDTIVNYDANRDTIVNNYLRHACLSLSHYDDAIAISWDSSAVLESVSITCARALVYHKAYDFAAAVLDGALKIGKQADPIDVGMAKDRMDKIKTACLT